MSRRASIEERAGTGTEPRGSASQIYTPTVPPQEVGPGLLSWLRQEFQRLYAGLQSIWDVPITYEAPKRATEGMVRFADGTGWNPGGGKGLYVYMNNAWVKL